MRLRIVFLMLFLAGIHCSCFAASGDSVAAGVYNHPHLKVEWTVRVEADKIILTGLITNASQGRFENIELLARALNPDRSEQGRERFVFIPNVIKPGQSAPFGMFFRGRGDKVPNEIEGTVYLEREGGSTGLEQEFYTFTAKVTGNEK